MSLYRQQYDAARSMFDETDTEPCIREAKKNFKVCTSDPTLPPYFVIKNCILVACALDDWNDADKELDQLQEFKVDDLTGLTKAQRQMFDDEEVQLNPSFQFFLALQNMDPDITEDEESDEDSNTAAENEMELATEKSGDEHAVAAAEHEMELVAEKFEAEHEVAAAEDEMEAVADYMQLPAISRVTFSS
ncbi:hypothetical protein BKA63DRAFT_495842 [Paraphoma chrysanthemicola]|nr:hypothetical protein BKA63DRAFT_495842 [Paraphoma chrysanthemicola]